MQNQTPEPGQLEMNIVNNELLPPKVITEEEAYGNDCPGGKCEM